MCIRKPLSRALRRHLEDNYQVLGGTVLTSWIKADGPLNMQLPESGVNQRIINLGAPVEQTDAARKDGA